MIWNLYSIRNVLSQGKKLTDLPLKVTFYARVSTDREEQLNSLENQVTYFENYIKKQPNWLFVPGYIDEGISGTSVKKRQQFQMMVEDAKKGKFHLILTKEISRFSRNTVDSIGYTRELLSYGVGVFFLNDNINTFDPDSELRLTIMSSIAQDEIRKLSERVRFGYKRSVEKGRVPGNDNIYGYKKDKGKLKIIEEEAEVVKLIFQEYSKGTMGTTKLGHYLYWQYDIRSKTGKPLAGVVLGRIIRNPKYKGFYCAHKETTADYRSKKRIKFQKDEWVMYKDYESCPPIVTEELWNKCNKILDKNSKNYKSNKRTDMRYALSGKIKCYHDGATFIKGSYKNKKTGEQRRYFGCSHYRKYGKERGKGCNSPIIYYEELLSIFKQLVNHFLQEENEMMKEVYTLVVSSFPKKNNLQENDTIDKKIEEIKNSKTELISMRARKELSGEEYETVYSSYNRQLDILTRKKEKILKTKQKIDDSFNLTEFIELVHNSLFSDEESIFRIFGQLIDKILVERKEEGNHKAILHFELNIKEKDNFNLSLDEFLLLFSNNEGCDSSPCRTYRRNRTGICKTNECQSKRIRT